MGGVSGGGGDLPFAGDTRCKRGSARTGERGGEGEGEGGREEEEEECPLNRQRAGVELRGD